MRKEMEELDRSLAVFNVETMEEHVNRALLLPRLGGALFGVFGAVGLLLAAIGLYSVMSFSLRRRTHEIGIRMALGAPAAAVTAMVLRKGLVLVGVGLAIGFALAMAGTRVTAGFL